MDKKKKKLRNAGMILAAIIVLNVLVAVLYRPIGPALYADAYLKGFRVDRMLERQHRDDDFMLVSATVERSDLLDGLKPNGYNYTFKSKKCKNEKIYAYSDLKLTDVQDNYLHTRYKDEAMSLMEKSLDAYFGKGHYCYYIHSLDSEEMPFYDTNAKSPDIYYYIGHHCTDINIITDMSLDAKNKVIVQNEILRNLNATFDTESIYINMDILFDKNDDTPLPSQKVLGWRAYYNYGDLDYWSEELTIENDCLDYAEERYSSPKTEWKTNDRKRFKYQTKNAFLNGAEVKAVINGFAFTPDGSVTFQEFLKQTGYVNANGTVKAKNFNPNDVVEAAIGKTAEDQKASLGVVNKTGSDTALENGSIYAISIGFSHEVETELFKGCSVCGLKIGDEMTEEELVKAFGPYEEKKVQQNNELRYNFVDGTEIGYATRDAYRKKLSVILQDGRIRFVSCACYEPDNRYVDYRDD